MLISAIMPTRGRPELAHRALDSFLSQTYARRELIILDDDVEPSFTVAPNHPLVRYERSPERMVPRKRNHCCTLAQGDIICHFDSDDWSAPDRLSSQYQYLQQSGLAVTGYSELLFWDHAHSRAFHYRSPRPGYVSGTSLMYRRAWWKLYPFNPNRAINSDGEFQLWPRTKHQLAVESGLGYLVATIHDSNMSQVTSGSVWDAIRHNQPNISIRPIGTNFIPKEFFNDHDHRLPHRQGPERELPDDTHLHA